MKKLSFGRISSLHGTLTSDYCVAVSEDGHALYGHTLAALLGLKTSVLSSGVVFRAPRTAFQNPNFLGVIHVF
jgi:hypothetical protein